MIILAITKHTGIRIAELGYILAAIAGAALLLAGAMPRARTGWNVLAGIALAVGSVLLIVAAHWGHYG